MQTLRFLVALLACASVTACSTSPQDGSPRNFGEDVAFLKQHSDVVVLQSQDQRVAIVPAYQGRVMTSSLAGDIGSSFGWINYDLVQAGIAP